MSPVPSHSISSRVHHRGRRSVGRSFGTEDAKARQKAANDLAVGNWGHRFGREHLVTMFKTSSPFNCHCGPCFFWPLVSLGHHTHDSRIFFARLGPGAGQLPKWADRPWPLEMTTTFSKYFVVIRFCPLCALSPTGQALSVPSQPQLN